MNRLPSEKTSVNREKQLEIGESEERSRKRNKEGNESFTAPSTGLKVYDNLVYVKKR